MATQARIAAQARRQRVVQQYAERRARLKEQVRTGDPEQVAQAVRALQRLPRDASPVRLRSRDQTDGRPRAYLRAFGVSRITFRRLAHAGYLPGVAKASR